MTSQRARHRDLAELLEEQEPDHEVEIMARSISRRLSVRRIDHRWHVEPGGGRPITRPYRHRGDDIDIDRTLERLVERPKPDDRDVLVTERQRTRRAAVLVIDVSGSMRGEKVRIAAATVAALSSAFSGPGDELAAVAFWSDAAILKPLATPPSPERLLRQLLRIPARGLTNVAFGLEVGLAELRRASAQRRYAFLLSDAVHNAGPDPRFVAHRYPQLHVMLETDGEHDAQLGAEMARLGHGRLAPIATSGEVAPALNRMLAR